MKNLFLQILVILSLSALGEIHPILEVEIFKEPHEIQHENFVRKIPEDLKAIPPTQLNNLSYIHLNFENSKLSFNDLNELTKEMKNKILALMDLNNCHLNSEINISISKNHKGSHLVNINGNANCKHKIFIKGNVFESQLNNIAYDLSVVQNFRTETFSYTF